MPSYKRPQNAWHHAKFSGNDNLALKGLRVIDLSRLVAGNMTSLQLADFGADVVKVEPLPAGDPLRAWKREGVSTFWKAYARNKRSIGLDFRADGAIDLLKKLIATADVMIEGFRPGTIEKMGLAPETLLKINPRLIILRVSGFGQTGSYSPRPGFGTLVEGMSGFAHRNGERGGDPLLPPLALADMISGLYGSNAIMMALHTRYGTGKGQVIDLSLLDSITSILGPEALDYDLTAAPKPRVGNGSNISCPRNVYVTSDGAFIAISASIQRMAERLFTVIGREDMNEDPRFDSNETRLLHRDEVDSIVGAWIKSKTREEVLSCFKKEGITAAPLYNIEDIAEDEHFIDREIYINIPDEELGHVAVHSPLPRLSDTPASIRSAAPELGENTKAVLADYGFSAAEIADIIDSGTALQTGD